MIKILIVDDQRLIREGLASLLKANKEFEVIGDASNGQEAIRQADLLRPDVILMDVRMPIMDGITATKLILENHPLIRILILTTFNDNEYVAGAMRAGASGYLLKDDTEVLYQAIKTAHSGVFQFSKEIAQTIIEQLKSIKKDKTNSQKKKIVNQLTSREKEVVELVAKGATNKEVAEELMISENTVKNHISNILSRLALRDRVQIVIFAYENGIIN
jgi:DNA-binding NarL/FixJ family response regulator